MRILVTGSAGFMGSHLVDYLIRRGHKTWGIDDLSLGSIKNVSSSARDTFIKLDLKDKEKTAKVVSKIKPSVIYHLAAWAHEGLSQFAPQRITENNLNAYLNLLIPAINVGVKRVVCCSSMAVYGDQKPPFEEKMPRRPEDIYGIAKTGMENITEVLSKVFGFEYVIIRPHNVYGPRQNLADPYRNVVAIFINRMLHEKPFYIYGDGEQTRAFSYIDDITAPLAKSGFVKKAVGEIINLGPKKKYSINYLGHLVLKNFGKDRDPNFDPILVSARPQEVKHAYSTSYKSARILGFKEKTSLEKGVEKMVKWAIGEGKKTPKYLTELEIKSKNTPETWDKRLI